MIERVVVAKRKDLGGFEVGRALPVREQRSLGPFVFLDHMGPATMAPGSGMDVRPHPHIGLATVTYLFSGEVFHRDSVGSAAAIVPGEVNWMTAGRGIVHSERTPPGFRATGGVAHGLQAWVALPEADEEVAPSFAHHPAADLPSFEARGARGRLLAGDAFGATANVAVRSPLFYLHWDLDADAIVELPAGHSERGVYVATGELEVDGARFGPGCLIVVKHGASPTIRAITRTTAAALGGEPLGPRYVWWNFVASRRERIEQAQADWREGRMKLPIGDDQESIPLPEGLKLAEHRS